MPREKPVNPSIAAIKRRWTIVGWTYDAPLGQPVQNHVIEVHVMETIVDGETVIGHPESSFVRLQQVAPVISRVEVLRLQLMNAGTGAVAAHLRAWRRALYEALPDTIVPADTLTIDD
jgi:hypothetical protein